MIIDVNNVDNWNSIVTHHEKEGNILVCKFGSNNCGPCIAMVPRLDNLSSKYDSNKVLFLSIDIDKNEEIATKFDIQSIPTTLIIEKCKVLKKIIGANMNEIEESINRLYFNSI